MATNPFKQSPPIPPSSNQISSSNGQQQNYDDRVPPLPCSTTTTTTTTIALGSAASAALINTSAPTTTTTTTDNSILKQRAPCACSNISIMQLFHEMKQKYPTVPDTVVSELVTQHCHDRPTCIGRLEEAVLGTPAQTTYPAQSIHSGSLKRRSGASSRGGTGRLPQDGTGSTGGSSSNSSVSSGGSSSSNSSSRESSVDSRSGGMLGPKVCTAARPTTLAVGQRPLAPAPAPPVPPMRPNRTAPLCPPLAAQLANSTITTTTTTTTATTSGSTGSAVGETVNVRLNVTVSPVSGGGQRHKSMISLQPEPPYSCELANVTSTFNSGVTPVAGIVTATAITPNARGPPVLGGLHAAAGGNGGAPSGRSSTSVNLTLRQPTDGRPHSPILVHASPLKYTSKNFNAQSGIQSKLEVTFGDGFGSFRAVRAHVPGYEQHRVAQQQQQQQPQQPASRSPFLSTTTQDQQEMLGLVDDREPFWQMPLTTSSPLPHVSIAAGHHRLQPSRGTLGSLRAGEGGSPYAAISGNLESDGLTKELRYQNFVVAEMAVSQQLEQKQRLSKEVERKRMQFELICREIYVLQKPLRSIDAELLNREVLLLAAEVEQLQKEVDSCDDEEALAAVAAAGAGVSITDGLSALSVEGGSPMLPPGNGSTVVNRPPRPPRPPPPRVPTGQSPCPSSSSAGSITPGTPLFPSVSSGHHLPPPFGIGYPASGSSSSSSPSSSSSAFTPSAIGGGDPLLASHRSEGESGGNSSSSSQQQQQPGGLPNQPWTCSLCTFQNHELMTSCEVCSLPKASVVTSGQDIHIFLSPGQNKIIHSWIVS
ncbi:mucin-5AC isoform X2 [Anopheles darlingi]|uniref:mucin-5AC isoform X2 n=1 Tax=Anopheles darlingi TaxID=43151 RepID=UPI0021001FD1|nr:mucin-5AC isoform X2 [Anopheles darlingi]